jgi:hypothetical protein
MKSLAVSWANTGLQFKLQILIQGFLFVVLLGTQQWFASQLEDRALAAANERALALADGMINSLNTLMVTKVGQQDVISDAKARALFVQKMGFSDAVKDVRVIRGKGTIDEFGPGLPQEQAVDGLDKQVLATGTGCQGSIGSGARCVRCCRSWPSRSSAPPDAWSATQCRKAACLAR